MLNIVFPKCIKINGQLVELILLILSTTSDHSLLIHFSSLGSTTIVKWTPSDKAKMERWRSRKKHEYAGLEEEGKEPP